MPSGGPPVPARVLLGSLEKGHPNLSAAKTWQNKRVFPSESELNLNHIIIHRMWLQCDGFL